MTVIRRNFNVLCTKIYYVHVGTHDSMVVQSDLGFIVRIWRRGPFLMVQYESKKLPLETHYR